MSSLSFECEDVIPATPQKIKKKLTHKSSLGNLLKFAIEPQARYHTETSPTKCYRHPFVFHEIIDIINFTEFRQPLNPNIKTLGIYKQNNLVDHRFSIFKVNSLSVKLKFLANPPQFNEIIEVYGYLSPEKELIVKFWTKVVGDVQQYWINLKLQKAQYTPYCYKEVRCIEASLCDEPEFEYFDQDDDSYLIENVDYIEELTKGIESFLNIDENSLS